MLGAASSLGTVDQWQDNAILLQQLWTAATGGKPSPAPAPSPSSAPSSSGPGYYAGPEQQLAIQCADSPSPRDLAAYSAAAAAGTFAPIAAWDIFGCADWPAAAAQDRYTGPWNRPTASNNPSTCAFNDMINYTITGALPAPGTVCQQNINPFP